MSDDEQITVDGAAHVLKFAELAKEQVEAGDWPNASYTLGVAAKLAYALSSTAAAKAENQLKIDVIGMEYINRANETLNPEQVNESAAGPGHYL